MKNIKNIKKIGFAVALEKELAEFTAAFKNAQIIKKGAYEVIFATSGDKELYMLQTGVGEISAACATQFLITAFGVQAVINFGVCGKINPQYKILDTVAIKSVVHYQFDTSAIDDVPPARYLPFESEFIPTDGELLALVDEVCPDAYKAICASGDKFVGDEQTKSKLRSDFGADVCEMEAAGVLLTAIKNGVPALIIKSVSDDCDAMDFTTYLQKAAKAHIELVLKLTAAV